MVVPPQHAATTVVSFLASLVSFGLSTRHLLRVPNPQRRPTVCPSNRAFYARFCFLSNSPVPNTCDWHPFRESDFCSGSTATLDSESCSSFARSYEYHSLTDRAGQKHFVNLGPWETCISFLLTNFKHSLLSQTWLRDQLFLRSR